MGDYEKYGYDDTRRGMAEWYALSVENARRNPKAQEHHNADPDPRATGMTKPNPKSFLEHINVFDCSKITDGASAVILASEEGLHKLGVAKDKAALMLGIGQCEGDLTRDPLAAEVLGMGTHDEHLLVVAPVEDADASSLGQRPVDAPEEVVVELLGRWHLEGEDLTPGRIQPGENLADRAVLARRVHRLEHEEEGVAVLGVEHPLLFAKLVDDVFQLLLRRLLPRRVVGR